jgi:putative lipoic acid-binding regulatory protein
MDMKSDNPAHGFQFPGIFELSAMGEAERHLEQALPKALMDAGIDVVSEQINWKHSSTGKYVSVRIGFRAESREDYDRAHVALREHPDVKWTI